ncbi:oxygenase MpaB family protein [Herbiconiux sp. P16]|uniref:oxygenase MpaB family protein n=1 Tax=Herbiconiux wuyangfengii TaxID=3342794 RepID=UPI0035B78098
MLRLADIAPESVLLAGAGRAILLQIAYPAIGYGVARHSDFANRPMDRLNATLSYIYALASGSDDDVRLMRRAVNRAHAGVRNPPRAESAVVSGEPESDEGGTRGRSHAPSPGSKSPEQIDDADPHYDAYDPHLQLWVAATLYDTALTVYQTVYGPLDDASADHVYREYARLGTTLQMPEELWPTDRAAFRTYWNDTVATLRVDDTIRGVADALLRAEKAPLAIRTAMPVARLVTVALLPESVRREYRFAWSPRRDRKFARLVRFGAPVYRVLPRALRRWPQRHYVARIRTDYA